MPELQPLSVRRGIKEPFKLEEGVPEHLAVQVKPLLWEGLNLDPQVGSAIAASLRIPISTASRGWANNLVLRASEDEDLFLDVIDLYLRLTTGTDNPWGPKEWERIAAELSLLFDLGHSAWEVAWNPGRLERRVSTEATQAYESAQKLGDAIASHLSEAWRAVFSRTTNPSHAWASATKALEAALAPLVIPNSPRPQYGQIVKAMEEKPSKWQADLPGEDEEDRVRNFITLLRQVPYAPDRHGKPDFTAIEEGQARSVVLITTAILEIVHQGGLKQAAG